MSIRPATLFKGCTRPAMIGGVPVVPLGILVAPTIMLMMIISPFFAVLGVVLFFVMRALCKEDDQRFRLIGLRLRYVTIFNRNGPLYGHAVFSPTRYRRK